MARAMTTAAESAAISEVPFTSEGELLRKTWSLAWPVIFSFSIESFVGLVDMLMVGRLGKTAVAGVGVGIQILGAVDSAMFAVGTGALAIVARHIGAGERAAAEETLRQAIFAAFGIALLVILPVQVWAPSLVAAFKGDASVVEAATPFLRVVMLGVPGAAVLFVIVASLRAAGDTRTPLAIGISVGLVNVLAGWVLIFGHFGFPVFGVRGAAMATALAFTTGATIGIVLLRRGQLVLRLHRRRFRVDGEIVRRILRIGYPAALEHLLMQVGFFVYIVFAAHYGTAPMAAYFIGVRILALSFLPGVGFSVAAGTMVGQNLGARRPREAERSGWAALRLSATLMSIGGVVIFFAARPIARLFVDDPEVIEDAVSFIRVLAAVQPLMAMDFTLGGALRGAGDTRFPLVAVFLGFYLCRLGVAWAVTYVLHLDVVWLWNALIGDYLVRSLLKGWRFRSGAWQRVHV